MNERIKKIAQRTRSQLFGMASSSDMWKEKFVELLLQECSQTLQSYYKPDDCITIEEVMLCLNEHFGNKE